jgi:4'-phosphopantetheinyl transferase
MSDMMNVYWLEQSESDVPATNDWLSSSEVARLNDLRFAKRRSDWRLGRWTAKRALATCLELPDDRQMMSRIEIRPATSGAPEVFLDNELSKSTISLSHRLGRAICGVVPSVVAIGCDLEHIESHSNAFVSDYFTPEEQALIWRSPGADRPMLLTLHWSAKESGLKALHTGLRLDTRSAIVNLENMSCAGEGWHGLQVSIDERSFHGWWRHNDDFVETVVADPAANPPILLKIRPHSFFVGADNLEASESIPSF